MFERIATVIRHVVCRATGGHFKVIHHEDRRVCLRCVACGHESPGWDWKAAF